MRTLTIINARAPKAALLAMASLSLSLGGCALAINGADDAYMVEKAHPITLDPVIEEVAVEVTPDTIVVSPAPPIPKAIQRAR